MKTRMILYADAGMVLTDGETYGREILLAEGVTAENFYEVPEALYEEMLRRQQSDLL
jgi:hypothetical protein